MISQQLAIAKDIVRMQESALEKDCLDFIVKSTGKDYSLRRAGVLRQGNWCGHNPQSPRFFQKPEAHKAICHIDF